MDLVKAVTLGIVQGLTEFLPISSSAHLKIVPHLLGWPDPGTAATAVMQLGTIVAVLVYFRQDLQAVVVGTIAHLRARNGGSCSSADRVQARLGAAILIGTIPISVAGLLLKESIETTFRSLYVMSAMLIGMALLLLLAEKIAAHRRPIESITLRDGLIVGLFQALALVPGASRSGSTLTGALFTGLERSAAARFSFLLSVPAIVLSGLFQLKAFLEPAASTPESGMFWTVPDLLVATAVSAIVGYLAIAWLIRFLQRHSTASFIAYRILLGIALLALLLSGKIAP